MPRWVVFLLIFLLLPSLVFAYGSAKKTLTVKPVGNGTTVEWTKSAGTYNFQCVDEEPPNGTDWNYTATINYIDLYTIDTAEITDSMITPYPQGVTVDSIRVKHVYNGASVSDTLKICPNGDAGINLWIDGTCGAGVHYTCVDEVTVSDVDYVALDPGLLASNDEWTLENGTGTIPSGATIDSVRLTIRGNTNNATYPWKGGIKIGTSYTYGTNRTNTSLNTYTQKLAKPTGGSWTLLAVDSLVAIVYGTGNASAPTYNCTWAYVQVYYTSTESALQLAHAIRYDGTNYFGSTYNAYTSTFTSAYNDWAGTPDSSATWSIDQIKALEIGVKVITAPNATYAYLDQCLLEIYYGINNPAGRFTNDYDSITIQYGGANSERWTESIDTLHYLLLQTMTQENDSTIKMDSSYVGDEYFTLNDSMLNALSPTIAIDSLEIYTICRCDTLDTPSADQDQGSYWIGLDDNGTRDSVVYSMYGLTNCGQETWQTAIKRWATRPSTGTAWTRYALDTLKIFFETTAPTEGQRNAFRIITGVMAKIHFAQAPLSPQDGLTMTRNGTYLNIKSDTKTPTWQMTWNKANGYAIRDIRQPYGSGTNLAGTNADNGGYGTMEFCPNYSGAQWSGNSRDNAPTITMIESTYVRCLFRTQAILWNSARTLDRGDVIDTIAVYYDRIAYNRTIVLDSASFANSYRGEVAGFNNGFFADWCRHVDDDQITLRSILQAGCTPTASNLDSLNARLYRYSTFNDTLFSEYLYQTQFNMEREVTHDETGRRGKGWNRYNSVSVGTYNHIFQFRISATTAGTRQQDTLGWGTQDRFMDLLTPASITCSYGDTSTYRWTNTMGCYNYQDANNTDSVDFTFTKASWTDTVFHPVIQIHHWNKVAPDTIDVGGVKKVRNTDFYADTSIWATDTLLIVHYFTDLTANTQFIIPGYSGGELAQVQKIFNGGENGVDTMYVNGTIQQIFK